MYEHVYHEMDPLMSSNRPIFILNSLLGSASLYCLYHKKYFKFLFTSIPVLFMTGSLLAGRNMTDKVVLEMSLL